MQSNAWHNSDFNKILLPIFIFHAFQPPPPPPSISLGSETVKTTCTALIYSSCLNFPFQAWKNIFFFVFGFSSSGIFASACYLKTLPGWAFPMNWLGVRHSNFVESFSAHKLFLSVFVCVGLDLVLLLMMLLMVQVDDWRLSSENNISLPSSHETILAIWWYFL